MTRHGTYIQIQNNYTTIFTDFQRWNHDLGFSEAVNKWDIYVEIFIKEYLLEVLDNLEVLDQGNFYHIEVFGL